MIPSTQAPHPEPLQVRWYQFTLRRLMLMITGMAVYLSVLKMIRPNLDNPFTSPIAVGIEPSFTLGAVLGIALLWPNRYTVCVLCYALLLWVLFGFFVCSSAAC